MDLYAAGFNAWNQLSFKQDDLSDSSSSHPEDIRSFGHVLRIPDRAALYTVHATLSQTVVSTSVSDITAGFPDEWARDHDLSKKIVEQTAAIAGNGIVVVYDGERQTFQQFRSLACLRARQAPSELAYAILRREDVIVQLVAFETGFVALSAQGNVFSWGDERYAACLGREVSEVSPADKPCLVEDLKDLPTGPIMTLAAGGYHVMALTAGKDLYFWGGHPGRSALIADIGMAERPEPVVIEDQDVRDCAVGDAHAIVLAESGDVYVVGDNTNGQLGIDGLEKSSEWVKIPLTGDQATRTSHVYAGPRNSFIALRRNS